jgi:hypothetical protein
MMTSMEPQAQVILLATSESADLAALLSAISTELDDLQDLVDDLIAHERARLSRTARAYFVSSIAAIRSERERCARSERSNENPDATIRLWNLRGILKRIRTLRRDALTFSLKE